MTSSKISEELISQGCKNIRGSRIPGLGLFGEGKRLGMVPKALYTIVECFDTELFSWPLDLLCASGPCQGMTRRSGEVG